MSDPDPARPQRPRPAWLGFVVRWRPWLWPAVAALLALVAGAVLWQKMRTDTWAYFTDQDGLRAEVNDEKARPVLWQDPEPQHFDKGDEQPDANEPGGQLEAAFSADGTLMLLTRWTEGRRNADMYQSTWDGRRWSPPAPIPSINTEANERGPALSHDGAFLYFASDREGGQGGYDLYAARWNGKTWTDIEALPPSVNTAANELGPALSPDGSQLFFSSDSGANEDIFVSNLTPATEKRKKNKPAPLPEYTSGKLVNELNSKAADVQAAMTSRGDHVFLASDRKDGFRLYLGRVVNGKALPPEEVDLYLENGDATDPAVRMEGFDLLFSTNQDASGERESEPGYRLYRTTTREVIGYTDLSRWEQFKELMHNIAWWILLAIAALIALLYILESWQDITSLFHKCLAGSALIHLIALLLAMLWLIAREISEDQPKSAESTIDLNAVMPEELAMESVPEEMELTETTTTIETEKVESEFGAPGFEPQEEAQAIPNAARPVTESVLVEARPSESEATAEPVPEPPSDASVLNEFTDTVLPEIEQLQLEEPERSEATASNEPQDATFEPAAQQPETSQAEPTQVADAAMESEATASEVTELDPRESLADAPKIAAVEPVTSESPAEQPAEQPELPSEMLAVLPDALFVDPSEARLEELTPAASESPADPSQDLFSAENAVPSLNTTQGESGEVADAAVAQATEATAVETSGSAAETSTADASPASAVESNPTETMTSPELAAAPLSDLPDLALDVPATATMEERAPDAQSAPADPAADLFQPSTAGAKLATAPTESKSVTDQAAASRAEATGVASATLAPATALEVTPPTMRAANAAPAPSPDLLAATALPASALIDPGTPKLEEPDRAGAPADSTADQFKPSSAVASVATTPTQSAAVSDTAVTNPGSPATVATGKRVSAPANLAVNPRASASASEAPTLSGSVPITAQALPDSSLLDPGIPKLEEPGQGSGAPANPDADQFKPGSSGLRLATAPSSHLPAADGASASAVPADAISGSSPNREPTLPSSGRPIESLDTPVLGGGLISPDLAALAPLGSALLPAKLEAPREMSPGEMAKIIQKQRGKPGLETIKQMGGSDSTEKAISAAIDWLVENQEDDGRWDTRKHGSKQEYDAGGTGLALLCFYGWGERHDAPGKYRDNLKRGLAWLIAQQDEEGYLGGRPGMMYSHAIASIALCEAYGLTKDAKLKGPAEMAIAYSLTAQSKSRGGWRYHPGEDSDTSVTGWQYMALHSARMAGLEVPEERFERARRFLDSVGGGKQGGLYGYQSKSEISTAMVATGMFCRQLDLVSPSDPRMVESARKLKLRPMKSSDPDLYYIYYATLALYQHQGPIWSDWNERLKEVLPLIQEKTGSKTGSWDPSSGITGQGGRVVSTALATLSLEVYYRLLPMYGFRNNEAEAPEIKARGE